MRASLRKKLSAGQVKYWQNGVEVPVDMVPENAITPDTVATLDADGTMHVLVNPGDHRHKRKLWTPSEPLVDEVDQLGVTTAGLAIGLFAHTTTMDQVEDILDRLESYNRTKGLWAAGTNSGLASAEKRLTFPR